MCVHRDDAERRRDCGTRETRRIKLDADPHDTEWKSRAFKCEDLID